MRIGNLCLLLGCMALVTHAAQPAKATLTVRQNAPSVTAVATVPWAKDTLHPFAPAALCTLSDTTAGIEGKVWMAVDGKGIYLRIVTTDNDHIAPEPFALWGGDGIELCIDARGDGTNGLEKDREGAFGPDDAKFMGALSTKGARLVRTVAADEKLRGEVDSSLFTISRSQDSKTTTYELMLPWTYFSTWPGLYETIGLAIQLNDMDAGENEKRFVKWGEGTFGAFRPGLFNALVLETAPPPFFSCAIGTTVLWEKTDLADAVIAYAGSKPGVVKVTVGDQQVSLPLEQSPMLRRYDLRFGPAVVQSESYPFSVQVLDKKSKAVLAGQSGTIGYPVVAYATLIARLDSLAASGGHPLFVRHLRSVQSLVSSEWARLQLYQSADPLLAQETHSLISGLLKGFSGSAAKWENYLNGNHTLFFAWVSAHDRSVQYYHFTLPRDWDPAKQYPLFFELHGAGNDHPLSGLASSLSPGTQSMDLFGYATNTTFAQRQRNGYHCLPFGRGNLGYRGIAEIDIWEAYDDVHTNFKIDRKRQYLYGFSMGGGGTWSIGTRTPDRWAAMAILAGGLWRESPGLELGRNLAQTPLMVWCGEKDELFQAYTQFKDKEIGPFHATAIFKTAPDLGHDYSSAIQEEVINWLQTHTLARPDKFEFVADTDQHRGVWGVTMERTLSVSALPRFTCTIDKNTVNIVSQGTVGLTIDTGAQGLELTGTVTIIWNGKKVFDGTPTAPVVIGTVAPTLQH